MASFSGFILLFSKSIVNRKKQIPTEDTSPHLKTGSKPDKTNYFAKAPVLFNYKGNLVDYFR